MHGEKRLKIQSVLETKAYLKVTFRYKTITSQNVPSEAQVKSFPVL